MSSAQNGHVFMVVPVSQLFAALTPTMSLQTPILPLAGRGSKAGDFRLSRVRGDPLAGEALGFGELGGRHLACN